MDNADLEKSSSFEFGASSTSKPRTCDFRTEAQFMFSTAGRSGCKAAMFSFPKSGIWWKYESTSSMLIMDNADLQKSSSFELGASSTTRMRTCDFRTEAQFMFSTTGRSGCASSSTKTRTCDFRTEAQFIFSTAGQSGCKAAMFSFPKSGIWWKYESTSSMLIMDNADLQMSSSFGLGASSTTRTRTCDFRSEAQFMFSTAGRSGWLGASSTTKMRKCHFRTEAQFMFSTAGRSGCKAAMFSFLKSGIWWKYESTSSMLIMDNADLEKSSSFELGASSSSKMRTCDFRTEAQFMFSIAGPSGCKAAMFSFPKSGIWWKYESSSHMLIMDNADLQNASSSTKTRTCDFRTEAQFIFSTAGRSGCKAAMFSFPKSGIWWKYESTSSMLIMDNADLQKSSSFGRSGCKAAMFSFPKSGIWWKYESTSSMLIMDNADLQKSSSFELGASSTTKTRTCDFRTEAQFMFSTAGRYGCKAPMFSFPKSGIWWKYESTSSMLIMDNADLQKSSSFELGASSSTKTRTCDFRTEAQYMFSSAGRSGCKAAMFSFPKSGIWWKYESTSSMLIIGNADLQKSSSFAVRSGCMAETFSFPKSGI
ncbi:uncharacterized protein LOC126293210 [Schistocerca gregaria]|uniref:uncharacterized protein LOC126293210 n=1 Tax=Schistocerca gregaria TaxID=7010 RepID=UPI00211E66CA|nr:uncharacterized protein LOC126293210 [Schistocerca gregaria]